MRCRVFEDAKIGRNSRWILVSEVINIAKNDIEPPPEYEARIEGDFLAGLGKLKIK